MTQKGVRLLSERDLRLLRLICEQYLVSIPQLAFITGRSERTARWLRTRWERAGLVEGGQLFVGDTTFVWATRKGLSLCGYPWKSVRPTLWAQSALAAVEVRLAVEAQYPPGVWRSRRMLSHETAAPDRLPDGEIQSSHRGTAVYIEQRAHLEPRELTPWVDPIIHRYDHNIYLAHPRIAPKLEALIGSFGMGYRASVIEYLRDPHRPRLPELPPFEQLHRPDSARRDERNTGPEAAPESAGVGAATDPTETEEERLRRIRPANYEAQIAAARHAEPVKRSNRGRRRGWM